MPTNPSVVASSSRFHTFARTPPTAIIIIVSCCTILVYRLFLHHHLLHLDENVAVSREEIHTMTLTHVIFVPWFLPRLDRIVPHLIDQKLRRLTRRKPIRCSPFRFYLLNVIDSFPPSFTGSKPRKLVIFSKFQFILPIYFYSRRQYGRRTKTTSDWQETTEHDENWKRLVRPAFIFGIIISFRVLGTNLLVKLESKHSTMIIFNINVGNSRIWIKDFQHIFLDEIFYSLCGKPRAGILLCVQKTNLHFPVR